MYVKVYHISICFHIGLDPEILDQTLKHDFFVQKKTFSEFSFPR